MLVALGGAQAPVSFRSHTQAHTYSDTGTQQAGHAWSSGGKKGMTRKKAGEVGTAARARALTPVADAFFTLTITAHRQTHTHKDIHRHTPVHLDPALAFLAAGAALALCAARFTGLAAGFLAVDGLAAGVFALAGLVAGLALGAGLAAGLALGIALALALPLAGVAAFLAAGFCEENEGA